MQTVTIELSNLDIQAFKETVDHGTEIVLTKQGNPVAHVVPLEQTTVIHAMGHSIARDSEQSLSKAISEAPDVHVPFDEADRAMHSEIAAYEKLHESLVTTYEGEYIALFRGQVVDHDIDSEQLLKRIDIKYPDEVVLIRQVLRTLPQPLRVRSPRFAVISDE